MAGRGETGAGESCIASGLASLGRCVTVVRLEGAAERQAGAGLHFFEGVAGVIDAGCARAARAGPGLAVVLAGKRDAVTFLDARGGGLWAGRCRSRSARQRDERRGSSKGKHSLHEVVSVPGWDGTAFRPVAAEFGSAKGKVTAGGICCRRTHIAEAALTECGAPR